MKSDLETIARELRAKFDGLDVDGSDSVSKTELAKALNGDALFRQRVRDAGLNSDWYVLEQMDGDADGKPKSM